MLNSRLGDIFFDKAEQYPEGSQEAAIYAQISGILDLEKGDKAATIQYFDEHIQRWQKITENPLRSERTKESFRSQINILRTALKELEELELPD